MRKYILTLFIAFIGILSLNANNIKLDQIIEKQVSEVVINMPSFVKIYPSEDSNTHIRFRSKRDDLLNSIYYKYDNKQLFLNTDKNISDIENNNIVIYLYVPNNNIRYITEKRDLFVNSTHYSYKNINKENHETNE